MSTKLNASRIRAVMASSAWESYYSAFGLAFQAAAGYARGVQRGHLSALVGTECLTRRCAPGRPKGRSSPLRGVVSDSTRVRLSEDYRGSVLLQGRAASPAPLRHPCLAAVRPRVEPRQGSSDAPVLESIGMKKYDGAPR
jgi:hypothetical protein